MPFEPNPRETIYRWRIIPLLVGALCLLGWAAATGWPPLRPTAAVQQTRLDTAVPAPKGEQWLEQPFTSAQAGLSEIELLVVRYEQVDGTATNGRLHLQLREADSGHIVASQSWDSRQLRHNQTLLVRFAPQPDSAGRPYLLRLWGEGDNPLSVWGYSLALTEEMRLIQHQLTSPAQILRFTTRYQMQWAALVPWVLGEMIRQAPYLLLTLLFIALPGLLWLAGEPAPPRDAVAQAGLVLTAGLAIWALIWLWISTLGGRVTPLVLWLLLAGMGLMLVWRWVQGRGTEEPIHHSPFITHNLTNAFAFAFFLLFVWGIRLVAVRDLAFLPWVDASRHGLITAVMRDNGRFLTNYEPYLPVSQSLYHVGFHTLPASLQLLWGDWPLASQLLWLMQWLSALIPLAIYAGTWWLTERREAAWMAAFWTAAPLLFPAYYTTWGRLTQLTGALLLPLLIAATWHTLFAPTKQRPWRLTALLASGIFLIHFRVFVMYLPLAGVMGGYWLFVTRYSLIRNPKSVIQNLLLAVLLALLLIAPRLIYLIQINTRYEHIPSEGGGGDYNTFPIGYLTTGWEWQYWALAAVLLVSLSAYQLVNYLRSANQLTVPLLLYPAWLALLALGTSGSYLGLPILLPTLNLNSVYILLFVPQAMFLGTAVLALQELWRRRPWVGQTVGYVVVGGGLAAVLLHGLAQQATVLNQTTLLAQPAELAAIEWLSENSPPTAKIGVSSWLWLGGTWAGSDGGAWITPLTGRPTTTPPIDYIYDRPLALAVRDFNLWAKAVADWSDPATAAHLRTLGITHLFVGQRGGTLDPAELNRNPALTLRYAEEGVFIWEVETIP